ncbi:MAG: polysaccharide deacetylase family protein [Candidatus Riflebacteria bacterium]|nr:polysaccharide deacetylase family protein [Candidatus Riflebacteria bacterium]
MAHACRLVLCGLLLLASALPGLAGGIAALCYHQVLPKATGLFELSVDEFREQMGILKAQGFEAINSRQLLEYLAGRYQPLKKPILLTFDDGYKSVYNHAFPIMKEFGFVGVACVYPQFIDSAGGMTWGQLREMASAGWSIEPHSLTHANLWKVPTAPAARQAFFEREIVRPKRIIEERTGLPTLFFTWPYGIYTEETETLARQAGYAGALTVDGGASYPGLDPFRVKRQVVYRTDTREKFLIRVGMGPLEVTDWHPRPGEVVGSPATVACTLPRLEDYSPARYVLNAKVTGGTLAFGFDPATRRLSATVKGKLKAGQHFVDIYLRDQRTGVTCQHGWLFTVGGGGNGAASSVPYQAR